MSETAAEKIREELAKRIPLMGDRAERGWWVKFGYALGKQEADAELLEVLRKCKTALYDAMLAGNLSRDYHNSVIVDVESAIRKYEEGKK
jgi:hypothetical protein